MVCVFEGTGFCSLLSRKERKKIKKKKENIYIYIIGVSKNQQYSTHFLFEKF